MEAHLAHNQENVGSIPTPAIKNHAKADFNINIVFYKEY